MTVRTRLVSVLALLASLTFGLDALAKPPGPEERLAALVRESTGSPNPAMTFLRGLGNLGNFELDRAGLRRALELSGAPAGGMLSQILDGMNRLKLRGERVEMRRDRAVTLSMGEKGALKLEREIEFNLEVRGDGAKIDDVDGIEVGETANKTYSLWNVEFKRENGKPVAKVTAGAFLFSKTVTIDLTPPARPADTTARSPSGSEGLLGAVGRATERVGGQ